MKIYTAVIGIGIITRIVVIITEFHVRFTAHLYIVPTFIYETKCEINFTGCITLKACVFRQVIANTELQQYF